jgi:hypothetical protein
MATPLFSIQEAVNSASSLPNVQPDDNHNNNKLVVLIENYKKSEKEYNYELRVLKSIIEDFDPVYNNHYDSSLDDITNEMVMQRKQINGKCLELVSQLLNKHTELYHILNLSNFDSFIVKVSEWSSIINELYYAYTEFYKLDINQSKSELKIRRRPLVRVRYLNNFFKTLKNILMEMDEKPYSSSIIANLEVTIFKLSKLLDDLRLLDERERYNCENQVCTANAKDIKQLRPVCVNLNQNNFNSKEIYNCDLHYINKNENVTLNFMKIDIVFLSNLSNTLNDQIAIIEKDNYGKSLIFAPLSKSEFCFLKSDNSNKIQSLLFNHSVLKDSLQICFTFNENTTDELSYKLLNLFPQYIPSAIYNKPTDGLCIKLGTLEEYKPQSLLIKKPFNEQNITPVIMESISLIPEPTSTGLISPISESEFTFENPVSLSTKKQEESVEDNSSNVPLYKLQFTSSTTDVSVSKVLNRKTYMQLSTSTVMDKEIKERNISQKFLQNIANDETSDEESIISITEELSLAPIAKLPTPQSIPGIKKSETINEVKEVVIKSSRSTKICSDDLTVGKKSLNLEKYQNSLLPVSIEKKKKARKSSLFGSLTNLLSKKNSKSSISVQKVENKLSKPKDISPTESLHSISSITTSKSTDQKLLSILNEPSLISKSLPPARISLWNNNSWTKGKDVKLVLHTIKNNTIFYMGFYDMIEKSASSKTISSGETSNDLQIPLLLIELTEFTECMFNPIDIHVKTRSFKGNLITLLLRPLQRQDMSIISNALVNPELIDLIKNSSSVDSELSNKTETDMSVISNAESMSSIELEIEEKQLPVVPELYEEDNLKLNKSWTGVGNLNVIDNDGKLKDLNRCVLNVERKGNYKITIDLTGFEFGNIELNVSNKQIKEMDDLQLLVKSDQSYIITFDSTDDFQMFNECIY